MSKSRKFFHGSSLLLGNNTVPGVKTPKELQDLIPKILQACRDFGLDFYPTVVQLLTYDEISEVAAYGGFPVRYPHWQWGMEYEELQRGYEFGMHKIYEMVINTNPCYIYNLNSNALVDHITVIAHATGHNDFFKNNVFFSQTSQNMMNQLANHGTRIRRYMSRWGKERVTEFMDHVLRIETLIDPAAAWREKVRKDRVLQDSRKYRHPRRLKVDSDRMYMEPFINTKEHLASENERIQREETAEYLGIFEEPVKDVLGFIRDNAPLKPWQQDIVAMLHEEELYFYPQRQTKVMNEGWASFIDYEIMARQGFVGLGQKQYDNGIVDYAHHKMGVLGGKYSMNPYKLGFCLFLDIEERWNKGQFGPEWDSCENMHKRENWDTKAMKGKEKIFEVRKHYDDVTFINEFFTQEFCDKYEFFEWQHYPNGETRIENRDAKSIRKKLVQRHLNGGLPEIKLVDPNHRGRGEMFLQHSWEGRSVYDPYVREVLASLHYLWGKNVALATQTYDGQEMVYYCGGPKSELVVQETREAYEKRV